MRPTLDQRLTIRGRLWLLLLALVLPYLATLIVSIWRQVHEDRALAGERMLTEARLAAARLDDHVGDIRQTIGLIARVVDPTPSAREANDATLTRLRPEIPRTIEAIAIWDAAGRVIGATDNPARKLPNSIATQSFFETALAAHGLVAQAPVRLPGSDVAAHAVFAMPILRDGRVVGVVTALTRLDALQDVLVTGPPPPRDGVTAVLNDSGVVVFRSVDSAHWVGRRLVDRGTADTRTEVTIDGPAVDGGDRIAAVARTRYLPWAVYVGIPAEVALARVQGRVGEYAVGGGAVLLLGLALASWIGRRISTPLRRLSDDAVRLERGEISHRSSVRQGGEIGHLANAMNRMADALVERTASLAESEARLREIADALPVTISYVDRDLRVRFANRLYTTTFGRSTATLLGTPLGEIYGEASMDEITPHLEAAFAGRRVVYERDIEGLLGPRRVEVSYIPDLGEGTTVRGIFVLMQDVTENRRASALQARSEQRLSLALEGAGSALIDWDIRAGRVFLSAHAAVFRGAATAREGTFALAELQAWFHADDLPLVEAALRSTFSGATERADFQARVATEAGTWIWIRARGRVVERLPDGRPSRFAGTCSNITERKLAEQRLQYLANYDALTGLPNRMLFHDRLAQAMARHARASAGTGAALLYLDIDNFKTVNDTLGHQAGDRLLVEVAASLRRGVRAADTVARLGGDEFTVILEELDGPAQVETIARALVEAARRTVGEGPRAVRISASIGVALLSPRDTDPADVIRRADTALYDAKRSGRDRFSFAAPRATTQAGELQEA